VIPFFAFPPEVRRVIYTNAIESVNSQLRKIIKTRGHFSSDDTATKPIWLALRDITANWGRAANNWKTAMNQFAILYGERFMQRSQPPLKSMHPHESCEWVSCTTHRLRRPCRGLME
jgi:putative transposase